MTGSCDTKALQEILSVSRKNNVDRQISGVLCYDQSFFMQCLEGPREAVDEIYARIKADKRHEKITLHEYSETDEILFENWTMGFLRPNMLSKQNLAKYSRGGKLNPHALNADEARAFLLDVAEGCRHLSLAKR